MTPASEQYLYKNTKNPGTLKALEHLLLSLYHYLIMRIIPGYTPMRNLTKSFNSEVRSGIILRNAPLKASRRC